jgi:hypothetical protein
MTAGHRPPLSDVALRGMILLNIQAATLRAQPTPAMEEAADRIMLMVRQRIAELEREVERLRAALEGIIGELEGRTEPLHPLLTATVVEAARRALDTQRREAREDTP